MVATENDDFQILKLLLLYDVESMQWTIAAVASSLDYTEKNLFVFNYVFTYILMPHNMMILNFPLPSFHVSNNALFFT